MPSDEKGTGSTASLRRDISIVKGLELQRELHQHVVPTSDPIVDIRSTRSSANFQHCRRLVLRNIVVSVDVANIRSSSNFVDDVLVEGSIVVVGGPERKQRLAHAEYQQGSNGDGSVKDDSLSQSEQDGEKEELRGEHNEIACNEGNAAALQLIDVVAGIGSFCSSFSLASLTLEAVGLVLRYMQV